MTNTMIDLSSLLNRFLPLLAISCLLDGANAQAADVDFEKQIRPILESRCWHCHGADEQESGLRLDRRADLLRGGDSGLPAVVAGQLERSYLLERITESDDDLVMPPDSERLSADEIQLLRNWIQQGAIWPGQMQQSTDNQTDHWSFQPVQRPDVPEVSEASEELHPVDAFLLRRLQQDGLSMSEPADARTLIRRVSLVLTGLPPEPQQVQDFTADFATNPDEAYERLVDQLLQSPHFGERWAQHWLDVIRWAESNGSESNLYRKNAWMYRDYVVDSINADKSYDQFVSEQIAGDVLGQGTATGFLVAGPHVPAATVGREPSAIRQARADRMDEIMQTVGASVLGLTVGCARCHNHKFDPLTITDYYAMTAVFQDVEFGGRQPERPAEHPVSQKAENLMNQIRALRESLAAGGGWEEDWGAYRELHFAARETSAVRLRFKSHNVGLDEIEVLTPDGDFNAAAASAGTKVTGFPEGGNEGRNPIDLVNDGEFGTMAWRANVAKASKERPWVQLEFEQPRTIDRIRLSNNREYYYETDYLTQMPRLPRYEFDMDVRTVDGTWQPWVGTWHVNIKLPGDDPSRASHLKRLQQLIDQLRIEGPQHAFVGRFVEPATTHVLLRGSPESPRDEVQPAGPTFLQGKLNLQNPEDGAARRKAFADWVTRPDHPLTARVMVNRIWHHVFGEGIVVTTSDFGKAGALPTHPELLDWLAAEFVQPSTVATSDESPAAWSVKHMIRMMVLSQAFRQSNRPHETGQQVDADGALLWRFTPRRVEAEVIRDAILRASGCLDTSIGGPSYRIHNEKKTYAQWEVVDNHGPSTWRRMLYQERMRRVDDMMFTAFDFPDCGQVRAKRPVSTTPLQALNLLNSEFVTDQIQRIAARALNDADQDQRQAVIRCFQLLLLRDPADAELDACLQIAREHGLPVVCRALINSNEFAFLP